MEPKENQEQTDLLVRMELQELLGAACQDQVENLAPRDVKVQLETTVPQDSLDVKESAERRERPLWEPLVSQDRMVLLVFQAIPVCLDKKESPAATLTSKI